MRECVHEHRVSDAIDAAAAEFPRIFEAIAALEWRLQHKPLDAVSKSDFFVYKQRGFPAHNIPDIVALYRYDGERVNIVAIHIERAV
jgi:hypothetical protein